MQRSWKSCKNDEGAFSWHMHTFLAIQADMKHRIKGHAFISNMGWLFWCGQPVASIWCSEGSEVGSTSSLGSSVHLLVPLAQSPPGFQGVHAASICSLTQLGRCTSLFDTHSFIPNPSNQIAWWVLGIFFWWNEGQCEPLVPKHMDRESKQRAVIHWEQNKSPDCGCNSRWEKLFSTMWSISMQ